MKFVIAPDSFKESMTARQACNAIEKGIKNAIPEAICTQVPLADGGEGTMQALVDAVGGQIFRQQVTGPYGQPVTGEYAILNDKETGVVELASASGLHLAPQAMRNPLLATTFGTGELIKAALGHGISKLVIGLGGSATNDGGVGIAQALGVKFNNKRGQEIGFGGAALADIAAIDTSGLITLNRDITIEIACDVTNPLTGPNGASAVFGPQKGATPQMVKQLDSNLKHLATKIYECTGMDVETIPGAGAAGGSGGGLTAFMNAKLIRGIDIIIKHSGLEKEIKNADYIITGEGSIDRQTLYGKTLSGVIAIAQKHHKPVIAFAGKISDPDVLYQSGFTSLFCILPGLLPLEDALANGMQNLENCVYSVAQVIRTAAH